MTTGDCRVPASLGWKEDPRPNNRSFLSPLFGALSPSSSPIEASVHPGLSARSGSVPSLGWPSVLVQTRRLRPQKPRRASFSCQVVAILPAIPCSPPPRDVLEGLSWGFSVARPWTVGGRWCSGGRAQRLPPSRRIASKRVPAESRRGPAVAAARARAPSVRRTGTEAAPGPPTAHPAQAEAMEGPGGRRPHHRARHALCRNS